jgi:hypothetical protein
MRRRLLNVLLRIEKKNLANRDHFAVYSLALRGAFHHALF